jgi:tetratricopeptide (TPR) repeat protein
MDNSTHDHDLIIRYIDGELDVAEKKAFEEKLLNDPALRSEVESLQQAKGAVRTYALRSQIADVHASMMKEMKAPVRGMSPIQRTIRYSVAIAASLALIFIGIQGYRFYKLSPERLYAENYLAYEIPNTRGNEDQLSDMEKAYTEKRYADITKMVFYRSLTPRESFLRGLAFLETGDLSRAITSFQSVLSDTEADKQTKDGAEYYLALAHLRNRDYDEAIELMSKVHDDPDHTYNERFSSKFIKRVKMVKWR